MACTPLDERRLVMSVDRYFISALQMQMELAARDVHERVRITRTTPFQGTLGETTITENLFFSLRHYFTVGGVLEVAIKDESKYGCDWEWVLKNGASWISIRCQAKVINNSGSFSELGHKIGNNGPRQIDTLINQSLKDRAHILPIYIFYAADPPVVTTNFNEPWAPDRGCSANSAYDTREILNPKKGGSRNTLLGERHLKYSRGWARVFDGLLKRLVSGEEIGDVVDSLTNIQTPKDCWSNRIDDFWREKSAGGSLGVGGGGGDDVGGGGNGGRDNGGGEPVAGENPLPPYVQGVLEASARAERPVVSLHVRHDDKEKVGQYHLDGDGVLHVAQDQVVPRRLSVIETAGVENIVGRMALAWSEISSPLTRGVDVRRLDALAADAVVAFGTHRGQEWR